MWMVRENSPRLERVCAWPTDLILFDRTPTSQVAGFIMPLAEGEPIHCLYALKDRRTLFPSANWHFLLQAAANLARAFAVVHQYGHVVGDVNFSNVLVTLDSRVTLIDCDSFQINTSDTQYLCPVGVDTYTPPELQSSHFNKTIRTENHDRFGLAVMIFQLLFLGRHPFMGKYKDREREVTLSGAIAEFHFAYGETAEQFEMERPANAPPLCIVTPQINRMFHRAFSPQGAVRSGRPSAAEWVTALLQMEQKLILCPKETAHIHYVGVMPCPWCWLEGEVKLPIFPEPDWSQEKTEVTRRILFLICEAKKLRPLPAAPLPKLNSGKRVAPSPGIVQLMQERNSLLGKMKNFFDDDAFERAKALGAQVLEGDRQSYARLGSQWEQNAQAIRKLGVKLNEIGALCEECERIMNLSWGATIGFQGTLSYERGRLTQLKEKGTALWTCLIEYEKKRAQIDRQNVFISKEVARLIQHYTQVAEDRKSMEEIDGKT